jgi:PAS domain S-box-containing protein
MAKKPIRIFRRSHAAPPSVPAVPAHQQVSRAPATGRFRPAVPVYNDTTNSDRMSITQRVVEHSAVAQARMRNVPSRFDALFHSIYDAVFITDLRGTIVESNARSEDVFMLSRDDLKGMNIIELVSGADERLMKLIRDNVDNRRFTIIEAVCRRADGVRFFSEIVVNKLKDETSNSLCILVRDVTDRKEAENKLAESNAKLMESQKEQVRTETVSTLFYAMNNPLQIMMCMAEQDENQEYKKQVDRIVQAMNALRTTSSLASINEKGGTLRYDIPEVRDLEPCDKSRILIVDDERILRSMFAKALSVVFPNLSIDLAASGSEAVDHFGRHHHGLVVMDYFMPNMNGDEAFEAIQAHCESKIWQLPPFVFCTGFAVGEKLRSIVKKNSPHVCLTKPLEISELVKTIQKHVGAGAGQS